MNKITFLFCFLVSSVLLATNPLKNSTTNPGDLLKKFDDSSTEINTQLNDLHKVNDVVVKEGMNYDALATSHADLVESTGLSAHSSGILDSHPDSPLGIGGFWWGFVLGWVGMLIVYLSMDEGNGRKEQVKNALYGCLTWVVIWVLLIFVVFAAAAT